MGDMSSSHNPADPRVLGTYDGDGSKPTLAVYRGNCTKEIDRKMSRITTYVMIYMSIIGIGYAFVGLYWLVAQFNDEFDQDIGLMQMWSPTVIFGLATILVMTLHDRHYWQARLRFLAAQGDAQYWHENSTLRRTCLKPRSKREFAALLQLAAAADHEKALDYVAAQTEARYHELIAERGLNMHRINHGWLRSQILDVREPDWSSRAASRLNGPGDDFEV